MGQGVGLLRNANGPIRARLCNLPFSLASGLLFFCRFYPHRITTIQTTYTRNSILKYYSIWAGFCAFYPCLHYPLFCTLMSLTLGQHLWCGSRMTRRHNKASAHVLLMQRVLNPRSSLCPIQSDRFSASSKTGAHQRSPAFWDHCILVFRLEYGVRVSECGVRSPKMKSSNFATQSEKGRWGQLELP